MAKTTRPGGSRTGKARNSSTRQRARPSGGSQARRSGARKGSATANGVDERPRPLWFHWIANMFFAGLALGGGILFGERVPQDRVGLLPILIPAVGLMLIPLTRRWERTGIEKRRVEAKQKPKVKREAKS